MLSVKKLVSGAGVIALSVIGSQVLAASPASAHTPSASLSCSLASVDLTNYRTQPGTDAVTHQELVSPAVVGTDAVYQTVIDSPATPEIPAVTHQELVTPAQPATYVQEYLWIHVITKLHIPDGQTRWEPQGWNGASHPESWVITSQHRDSTVVASPATDAVYQTVVDSPAIPAKDAVTHQELVTPAVPAKDAVYQTVVDSPAVPANNTPNTVSITVDGATVVDNSFGTNFAWTENLDPTLNHHLVVDVAAWDDPAGYHGWSWHFDQTTEGCQPVTTFIELPAAPVPGAPDCTHDGSLTVPEDTQVIHWAAGPDANQVTATVVAPNTEFVGGGTAHTFTEEVLAAGSGLDCTLSAIPVELYPTTPDCTSPNITVEVPATTGVDYVLIGQDFGDIVSGTTVTVKPGESFRIEPFAQEGYRLVGDFTQGIPVRNILDTTKCSVTPVPPAPKPPVTPVVHHHPTPVTPVVPVAPSVPSTPSATTPALALTGSTVELPSVLGLLILGVGSLLVLAGRRRKVS